jgi:hypothetical protein
MQKQNLLIVMSLYLSLKNGGLAEWLCSGLQIRVHQFDSGIRLHFARVVELVDTRDLKSLAEKRAGSSPAPGTISSTILGSKK